MLSLSKDLLSNTEYYTKKQYEVLLEISKKLSRNNTQIIKDLQNSLELYKILPNLLIEKSLLIKLLPNFNIDCHKKHLSLMGIEDAMIQGKKEVFSLNIYQFVNSAIINSSPDANFEDRVEFAFNLFDINSRGFYGLEEINKILTLFSEANTLGFDTNLILQISNSIMEAIDTDNSGCITKDKLSIFLEKFKSKPLKLNAFCKDKSKTFKK